MECKTMKLWEVLPTWQVSVKNWGEFLPPRDIILACRHLPVTAQQLTPYCGSSWTFTRFVEWRLWKRRLYQRLRTICLRTTTRSDRLPLNACATLWHVKRWGQLKASHNNGLLRVKTVCTLSKFYIALCFRSKSATCRMATINWSCWCCYVVKMTRNSR